MRRGRIRRSPAVYLLARGAFRVASLMLLALLWMGGQAVVIPTAHASGIPYCPNPLVDERAPTRPALHLNRAEGPVGTNLTFTVAGWRPGAHVTLHVDGRDPKTGELYVLIADYARGTVASDGAVSLSSLAAPSFLCVDMTSPNYTNYQFDDSGDETAWFVLVADDGAVSAPLAFRYLPAPTVRLGGLDTYGSARVGATITVSSAGWEPDEALTLNLVDMQKHTPISNATPMRATADANGAFTATYPLDPLLPWNGNVLLAIEGTGSRFGTLTEYADFSLLPAAEPTFRVDHTLVTPGMAITLSGEGWYPGATYTIKYCAALWTQNGWEKDGNCGKSSNPALGDVTIDAQGRMRQRLTIPADEPLGVVILHVYDLLPWMRVPDIAVHVVDHLPTWDDIHPRVAAVRNKVVGSLPVTIPGALALGALAYIGIRRWRARRAARM